MLEATDRPSALAASIALNCLRRLAHHWPTYSSLIHLISGILEDAVFQEDAAGETVAELRAKVRDLLGGATSAASTASARPETRSRRRRRQAPPCSVGQSPGRAPSPPGRAATPSTAGEQGSNSNSNSEGRFFLTAAGDAATHPAATAETLMEKGDTSDGGHADGSDADEGQAPPAMWRPVRRVLHSETAGGLARDAARLAAAYASAKRELAAHRTGEAPLLFRGIAEHDAAAVEQVRGAPRGGSGKQSCRWPLHCLTALPIPGLESARCRGATACRQCRATEAAV